MTLTVIPQKPIFTGTAPNRLTQQQTEFSANADNMMGYISTEPDSQNAVTTAMNALANEVEQIGENVEATATEVATTATVAAIAASTEIATTAANNALQSENSATASAVASEVSANLSAAASNYAGVWSTLTGALAKYSSVSHNSGYWMLENDLADITLSEPSDSNADWTNIQSVIDTVARGLNVANESIGFGVSGTVITAEMQYLYDPTQQLTYGLPETVGVGEIVSSISLTTLTTDVGDRILVTLEDIAALVEIADTSKSHVFESSVAMQASAIILPEGKRIEWQGHTTQSDSGNNWGIVKTGTATDDSFEIFTLNATQYVQANIKGTINPMMAGLFGGTTDLAKMQNVFDKSNRKILLGREVVYDIAGGLYLYGDNKDLDLNGATLNFTTTVHSVYDKGNNNEIHGGLILTDYTPGSGGNGHAGSCITVGTQSDGTGQNGFKYHHLELTTNRTDAGAHISGIGENWNGRVTSIKFRDNAVCRNLIGFEWGGTALTGTGHPHDTVIKKLEVGKITTLTYGLNGYAYVVWVSAGFNVSASSITCEEAYGLIMNTAGDNSNTYAPDSYKSLIGTGNSIKNSSIAACYGVALRAAGSTTAKVPCNLLATGITAVGKKVGANNNFALQTEFTAGVHLSDFKFSGVWGGGTTTGSNVDSLLIENGEITGCELFASSLGSGAIKSIRPIIRNVSYYKNNTLGGASSGTATVTINASDDAVVEHCSFGKEGDTETQRYSVYTAATANRPKIMHNHTYVNDNATVNPYLNGSVTVYDENNTKDF